MKKLYALLVASFFACPLSASAVLTDTEKALLAQEKLHFIDSQKKFLNAVNLNNKYIYKQAQDVAHYI